jgi:hypothetical protein
MDWGAELTINFHLLLSFGMHDIITQLPHDTLLYGT